MEVFLSDARIDELISEDVPYLDLTTEVLGIGSMQGTIEFLTRESCVLCGSEEVVRILERLGANIEFAKPSGQVLEPGEFFLRATGPASALHKAWKVSLNVLDHTSAVATKTAAIVQAAKRGNPRCEVLTTRKSMPGCKDLLIKAISVGGAYPHRLGLSETVLIFDNHTRFMGGVDGLIERLPDIRSACIEKKLFVEANAEDALKLAQAGVDGIQLEKLTPEETRVLVERIRAIDKRITLISAGGINELNAEAYAASGVDGLATTAPYTAKPIDMSAKIVPSCLSQN